MWQWKFNSRAEAVLIVLFVLFMGYLAREVMVYLDKIN